MEDSTQRSRKRVRQACEPCRRKKGRCPGEKPSCSLCTRLGQVCVYSSTSRGAVMLDGIQNAVDPGDPSRSPSAAVQASGGDEQRGTPSLLGGEHSDVEKQMQSLDNKVTEVLGHIRLMAAGQAQEPLGVNDYSSTSADVASSNIAVPSADVLAKAVRLYLQFCHAQPLALFSPSRLEETISVRDPEVRLCICGVSLRFDRDSNDVPHTKDSAAHLLQSAKTLTMRRLTDGKIELSTLQSLCLLALADFNDGRHQQAGIYLGLASELARSARLEIQARKSRNRARSDEHVRCLWGIIMLQYLCSGFGAMTMVADFSTVWQPPSDASNDLALGSRQSVGNVREGEEDVGVVAYAEQMTEVWYRVRQYVHHRGKLDKHPPWSGQSIYSSIMFRQMEMESQMPHKHRFKPSGFSVHSVSLLSTNRHYWAPWLYLQVIYHAIVCTLNHPLLLSIQLRRFRVNQIPELFLQSTADMMNAHTDWVIHLLELAAEKDFEASDPFLGHCIAIVATIFLQQSYTDDPQKRAEKQAKYLTCLRFVQSLGKFWLHVRQMAVDLETFEKTLSKAFEISALEKSPDMSKYVDLSPFWRILDNTHYPTTTPSGSRSIFGPSLTVHQASHGEREILSTRLLPEPTRVNSLPMSSTASTPAPAVTHASGAAATNGAVHPDVMGYGTTYDPVVDSPFLAQNIFALGQDFVGNAEDWFNWQLCEQ